MMLFTTKSAQGKTRANHFAPLIASVIGLMLFCSCTTMTDNCHPPKPSNSPIVAFLSDFGTRSDAVGVCHGIMLSIEPQLKIIDFNHNITPFNISEAALSLKRTDTYPPNTIFMTVVDPGVGTERMPIAIKTKKSLYYLLPNNGVVTYVAKTQGIEEVYEIIPQKINARWVKGTFDGRDLFAPATATLAKSNYSLSSIGKKISEKEIIFLEIKEGKCESPNHQIMNGIYIATDDPYGNIWSNISLSELTKCGIKKGDYLTVTSGTLKLDLPFIDTFGDVKEGKNLAYINSDNNLALAINMGNFQEKYKLKIGAPLTVKKMVRSLTSSKAHLKRKNE